MLARQYQEWLTYPPGVSIIIVDDCSRETAAIAVPRPVGLPPLRIYRIGVWKDWGWPMARNLGMSEAADGWCLLTDLDHVLDAENAAKLLAADLDPKFAYRPSRTTPDSAPVKRHNDSFALTREMFWRTGGYRLRYLGWYGTSSCWSRRLGMFAAICETDQFKLTVYNMAGVDLGGVAGAGTTGMGRKGSTHHVGNSPFAGETRTAHLTAETDPLAFPWSRQL
jgi:glycosyltransferase involved in cell wall biosynthesis